MDVVHQVDLWYCLVRDTLDGVRYWKQRETLPPLGFVYSMFWMDGVHALA